MININDKEMEAKLVDPWWDKKLNTITGFKSETKADTRHGNIIDEVKYFNAYPTLEIKEKNSGRIKVM